LQIRSGLVFFERLREVLPFSQNAITQNPELANKFALKAPNQKPQTNVAIPKNEIAWPLKEQLPCWLTEKEISELADSLKSTGNIFWKNRAKGPYLARKYFKNAQEFSNPSTKAELNYRIALCYLGDGKYEAANQLIEEELKTYEGSVPKTPDNILQHSRLIALSGIHDFLCALTYSTRVADKPEDDVNFTELLKEAIKSFEQARKLDPSNYSLYSVNIQIINQLRYGAEYGDVQNDLQFATEKQYPLVEILYALRKNLQKNATYRTSTSHINSGYNFGNNSGPTLQMTEQEHYHSVPMNNTVLKKLSKISYGQKVEEVD
jgi:tetratricopeptide (TPR) repeat protein